jgi:hypothetical protein
MRPNSINNVTTEKNVQLLFHFTTAKPYVGIIKNCAAAISFHNSETIVQQWSDPKINFVFTKRSFFAKIQRIFAEFYPKFAKLNINEC